MKAASNSESGGGRNNWLTTDAAKHEAAQEYIEKVVSLNRVSKTVKGGRIYKFAALVVVGDGKGKVGYGLGKASEVSEAILKGIADAKKNMVQITLSGTTIPHEVIGIYGAGSRADDACFHRYRRDRRRCCPFRYGGGRHHQHSCEMHALQEPPERR